MMALHLCPSCTIRTIQQCVDRFDETRDSRSRSRSMPPDGDERKPPRAQSADLGRKAREALVRRSLIAAHGGIHVLLEEMANTNIAEILEESASPASKRSRSTSRSPLGEATRQRLRGSPHQGAPWALGSEYKRMQAELASLQSQMAFEKAEKVRVHLLLTLPMGSEP